MQSSPPDSTAKDQNQHNKQAWDALYASTRELVWGAEEVGFLRTFLAPEVAAGRSFRRALDAATGEGRNLTFLLDIAQQVSACDSSKAALGKVPAALRSAVRLEFCDLARTPFARDSFDFILLCDTIETVPDPIPVLREMRRIMMPGGMLVCNFPPPEGDVAGIEMTAIGGERYLYQGRYYYKFFNDDEVRRLLAETGWHLQRAETMTWQEAPHPEFRPVPHQHCSQVCLLTPAG
jgi:SAM-dependent methyltransferase